MAVVKPLRGWHYNSEKFSKLDEVVVPPYDVISPAELQGMKTNSHNYTHIILAEGESKHKLAASLFKKWQDEKVLVRDAKPSLYFYRQTFSLKPLELFCQDLPEKVKMGGSLSRTGILCAVGLEDYSAKVILPHEKTFSGPKADRYNLMDEAQGHMEPVFLGYDSPRFSADEFEKIVVGQKPTLSFKDASGVQHELWAIADEKVIQEVEAVLAAKPFYILDGHHRYETALKYYNDHKSSDAKLGHRYVLAAICSFRQPGTVILPTHRAIKKIDTQKAKEKWTSAGWEWTPVDSLQNLEAKLKSSDPAAFGLKLPKSNGYIFLSQKNKSDKLDLEILHEDLLPAIQEKSEIDYIKDIAELESKTNDGFYDLGILVKPNTTEEVMSIARAGKVMPHKSTFFYPKIPSGLIINTFD